MNKQKQSYQIPPTDHPMILDLPLLNRLASLGYTFDFFDTEYADDLRPDCVCVDPPDDEDDSPGVCHGGSVYIVPENPGDDGQKWQVSFLLSEGQQLTPGFPDLPSALHALCHAILAHHESHP